MTIGEDLFMENDLAGSSVRVSGPGSQLIVNGSLNIGTETRMGGYRIYVEDEGLFAVAGDAGGDEYTAGIHMANGILAVDSVDQRPDAGTGRLGWFTIARFGQSRRRRPRTDLRRTAGAGAECCNSPQKTFPDKE